MRKKWLWKLEFSIKDANRLMLKINDSSHDDINQLNAMKRQRPKVTQVMTESTRTVLEVIQQDCTVTQKRVVQKLNDIEYIRH